MTRNYTYTFVFTLAITSFCVVFTQLYPIDYCSSALAKGSKTKDNQTKTTNGETKNKAAAKFAGPIVLKGKESDWRKQSSAAAELIFNHKFSQGDAILIKILPIAREEDPNDIDYGVCLARYGHGLMGERKYPQSLIVLHEAYKVIQKTPSTKRKHKALFQILKANAIVYCELNQFAKAEEMGRKAIAYCIAFPNISSLGYLKKTYEILRLSLEQQKKLDEAAIIVAISNTLS